MNKFAIVAVALTTLVVAPAGAADLPVKAVAPAPVWSWTGFYVGGNVGGGMASSGFTDPCFYCSSATPTRGFFTGGAQAGYNYQFGNGLVGIEADVSGNSGLKGSVIGGGDNTAMAVGMSADLSGTIRARAGVVLNNTLFYATGGAAWADIRQTGTDFRNTSGPAFGTPTGITANVSGVVWGGVIGAGFEYALSPHWTFGGEFLHTVYADRDANILFADGTNACGNSPATNCVVRGQLTTDVARIRLNYRFGDETIAPAYAPAGAMYRKAPAAVYSWTGFYLGGNVGAGMASTAFTDPCFYCSNATPTGGFFTGGVQAGYNYQFGNGLVGVEADINGNSGFKKSLLGGDNQFALAVGTAADVSGSIRARAGVVVNNALVYTTGGAAWADVRQTGTELNNFTGPTLGTPTGVTANASGVLWGGVIGAGVEFAVSPNWTLGAEFLHTVYQDRDANIFDARQVAGNACLQFNRVPSDNCVIRGQLTTDVLRVRANYKFGGPASADPAVNAPVTAVSNWTGFYVGGNVGGGMAMSRFDDPCFFGGCSSATPTRGFFTGGAQAGYNYQFGRGLVGVEVDLNGNSNFKNSVIGGDDQRAETVGIKADTSGTIRARGGLVMNNALVYATGGAAWADARQTAVQFFNATNLANFGTPTGVTANASGVIWGGVIGAGIEFALSPNWTVGGEVLHTMYADRSATLANANGISACGTNVSVANCTIRAQLNTDVARIKFNYRFDGPVVAKY